MQYKTFLSFIFTLFLVLGCSGGGKPSANSPEQEAPKNEQPQATGSVVNRMEQAGDVAYKLYLQEPANGGNRKGIVLFGSGNDDKDPKTGGLDGPLENSAANELAKLGYVAAVVAYRDQPAQNSDEGWNKNSEMLATDMSNVANAIIASQGGGLTRGRVVTGGVSYTSYALLTNISMDNSPLADTRGFMAACGSTGDLNPKIPIFSLNCSPNPDGDFNGPALIDKIPDAKVKADSGFFADTSCNSHCGGDTPPPSWTTKFVERVQLWMP